MEVRIVYPDRLRRKFLLEKLPLDLRRLIGLQKTKLEVLARAAPLTLDGIHYAQEFFTTAGKTYAVGFSLGRTVQDSPEAATIQELLILRIEETNQGQRPK